MREKELRLALICYGGISLAIYMHGITKEIWHLARASRDWHQHRAQPPIKPLTGLPAVYADLLQHIETRCDLRLRVVIDIVAGASAGGINGIFLAQAIQTGQSLEPLTDLWLSNADVDRLLDPDARPAARFTKFWAAPIVWMAARRKDDTIERTVSEETREEVRQKLSHFVRSRWFQPPFGGEIFTGMILDALDSMAASPTEEPLLPAGYPLDLMVTVTDFEGYPEMLRLNSPPLVMEMEHRLTLRFRQRVRGVALADKAELTFAARATASFPGAFPPFTVKELDRVLAGMKREWPGRSEFLARALPKHAALDRAEDAVLIDGSVLSNAPFAPAIDALRNRPARREIDRRFVYIDPKPMGQPFTLDDKDGDAGDAADEGAGDGTGDGAGDGSGAAPGFFRTIFGSLSDIPREQPIRDNVEAIEARSRTIRRMRRITDALRNQIEQEIEGTFGGTLFLDRPTPSRLAAWRARAQKQAATAAGFAYPAYAMVKLSSIVEEIADMLFRLGGEDTPSLRVAFRQALWNHVRERGLDQARKESKRGAANDLVRFFLDQDLGFRIRRLRFMARRLTQAMDNHDAGLQDAVGGMRKAIYTALTSYQETEAKDCFNVEIAMAAKNTAADPAQALDALAAARDLKAKDVAADHLLAQALNDLPKEERRQMLLTYLGFPFYDIATLPLLQGEGLDEYDPIKVDRISPEDCSGLRAGGAEATLKGIEFNNFGAFFSRTYRENDYLWGRLHGAERLIDIVLSTLSDNPAHRHEQAQAYKKRAFAAILEEEEGRLTHIPDLIAELKGKLKDNEI
ncbi:MAG: patatin-like protein [Sphingobium sp.]